MRPGRRLLRRRGRRDRAGRGDHRAARGTRTPRPCCGSPRSATSAAASCRSSPASRRRWARTSPAAGSPGAARPPSTPAGPARSTWLRLGPGARGALRPRQRPRARGRPPPRPAAAPMNRPTRLSRRSAADRRPRRCSRSTDVDVVLGRGWRANHVLSGVEPEGLAGRDRRPGRRDRLRQDHPGQDRGRPGPAADGPGDLRRHGDLRACAAAARRRERRSGHVQLVFQDPLRSLDPDLTVAEIVGEGLKIRGGLDGAEIRRRVDRRPGQGRPGRDAAAPHARPDLRRPAAAGLDRPGAGRRARGCCCATSRSARWTRATGTTSCGCSRELRDSLGLPIVIISHDLSSLAGIADRVVVLYRGRIVEDGPVEPGVHRAAPPLHGAADGLRASRPGNRPSSTTGPLSVHQLRRTTADPAPPSGPARASSPPAARSPSAPARVQPPPGRVADALERGLPPARRVARCRSGPVRPRYAQSHADQEGPDPCPSSSSA